MSHSAPRYPLEGVVSWNMNTTCNFRCSYCTQRFVDDRKQWAKDLPAFIQGFVSLPGDWEVKLSGGEPFRHPGFVDAVSQLAAGGLRVSVVSNFSASREALQGFAEATRDKPGVFSASLHLEWVEVEEFFEKARWFQEIFAGRFCVTLVATRENWPRIPELVSIWPALKLQPEKQDRDVVAYTPAERTQLQAWGGHNGSGHIDPDLSGRACWAGARYFIVDHKGQAYRCYPSRRYRKEYLGNLLDGSLRLGLDATPCTYSYCNCTVPQQRGMVPLGD